MIKSYTLIATVISERDEGIYDAMNKGIRVATGDIIGISNSDDIYANDQVISRVANIFKDTAIQACYGDLEYVDAHNTSRITRSWKSGKYNNGSFYWG